jgi:D-serine deaminase-like pyridoxal phosphate-dependent protein
MENYLGKPKSQLDTPVLVLDKNKLFANLKLMQDLADTKKVVVRPHAKTHKCTKLAKLQLEYGACGICVTKVSEAMVMAQSGINGLLITSPVVTIQKIDNLIKILKIAPDTMIVVDSLANAKMLDQIMQQNNLSLNILLDIDAGIGRTGVNLNDAVNIALQINQLKNLEFKGIQCYAGHLQHIADLTQRRQQSHAILSRAGDIKMQLLNLGLDCRIQTGSGTGTFSIDAELTNVSEIQPGSYCVMDQEYSNIAYKEQQFLPAMTMLTTVISANHVTHVTVDAGTKALYKVATRPKIISHPHLAYDWDYFGDEHGKVSLINEGDLPLVGEVLELVVAHCDPTINLFDYFYIVENDLVIDRWDIDLRGKLM